MPDRTQVLNPGAAEPSALGSSELYVARQHAHRAEAARQLVIRDRVSTGRLIVFVALVSALYLAAEGSVGIGWWAPTFVLGVGFIQLVRLQRVAEGARSHAADLERVNREAAARVERAWDLLPPAGFPGGSAPAVARDLGLFGEASLFQLLGTARTPAGRRTLARWLLDPAPAAEVAARQASVREIAPALDARQELEREGLRACASGAPAIERFLAWVEEPQTRAPSPLVLLARVIVGLMVTLGSAHALGVLPPVWIALIPINASIWIATARRTSADLAGLELRADAIEGYATLFASIERSTFCSDRLVALRSVLKGDGRQSSSDRLRRLRRIAEMAEVQYSPLLHIPLQLLFLWDTHVLHAANRWRSESGMLVRDWLSAVGEIESIAALAGLAFDNPAWAFPEVASGGTCWEGESLAHPLLHPQVRVANDVQLGPPGRLLLVTGSNMSGKSTLLRAIGLNVVLAHAGGPVCAARFRIPPTRLGTSFVIEDSLRAGVSYFLAELQRLKGIVEEAAEVEVLEDWRYLFLLDEILKGTNSGERQIAVRRVLSILLEKGAAGAITSHDLALADLPALMHRSVPVHFREHFESRDGAALMVFDYVLRGGIASTSNALALLEIMGIGDIEPACPR